MGIPTLHRMDTPAVADNKAADLDRLGERRTFGGRQNPLVDGEIEFQFVESLPKTVDRFELCDFGIVHGRKFTVILACPRVHNPRLNRTSGLLSSRRTGAVRPRCFTHLFVDRFRRACPGGSDNWRATLGCYRTPSRSICGSPSGLSRREHDLQATRVPTQSLLPPGQARRRAKFLASHGSQPVVIPLGQAQRKSDGVRLFTTTRRPPPPLKSSRTIGRGARSPFERPQPRPRWYAAPISASAVWPQNGKRGPRPTCAFGSFFVA